MKIRVRVRVPATTGNVGPGFDCMGIALQLYNEVEVKLLKTPRVELTGPISPSQSHGAMKMVMGVARDFFRKTGSEERGFSAKISGDVPIARGLGSSVTVRLGVMAALNRLFGKPPEPAWALSPQRLQYFLTEGAREGVLSAQQNKIAGNIMRLATVKVRDVMIPLDQVCMVPLTADPEAVRLAASERAHSRLPVYDGDRANIRGVLNLIDFLAAEGRPVVAELVRPLIRISQDLSIDLALIQLQRRRQVMAAVVDESDRALGLATVKDMVEEVVGELHEW